MDAYSRYLHSLSLAALIAVVGMPFSDVEVVMFEIKALALIFISIILLIMGSNLLRRECMNREVFGFLMLGVVMLIATIIYYVALAGRDKKKTNMNDVES